MPNSFAFLVLFSWPLVALVLFRVLPPVRAMIWTILAGYLFLPVRTGINLPMLPTMDKLLIPAVSATVLMFFAERREIAQRRMAAMRARRRGETPPPEAAADSGGPARRTMIGWLSRLGIILALLLPLAVFYTNREPISYQIRTLPAMRLYDAFSMALSAGVMLLPFLLGRRYLRNAAAQTELLRALAIGGIVYSLLILVEVRMSPQINVWTYGFFASSFAQHVRGGDFRPIIFLEHGLRVGIYMTLACLAAAALSRLGKKRNRLPLTLWLAFALLLSQNLGAFVIALALLPCALFAPTRPRMLVMAGLAAMVLLYPMIRGAGLVPTEAAISLAEKIDPARAGSLQFRLNNEDRLLEKANQKPWFGWGIWGRSRVFDEEGRDISTTDGVWIILMGVNGWIGYLCQFGLLTLPLLTFYRRRRRQEQDNVSLGLGLLLAANLVDMLPNSSLTPLTWLIAGALTGRLIAEPAPQKTAPARRPAPNRRGMGPAGQPIRWKESARSAAIQDRSSRP